jgi:hypothetical protein
MTVMTIAARSWSSPENKAEERAVFIINFEFDNKGPFGSFRQKSKHSTKDVEGKVQERFTLEEQIRYQ